MHATRIIAIRHGETAWNVDTRIQGHLDIPLNDTGLWQARQVGQALADEAVAAIYSSDLQRAYATAEAVARTTGAPLTPVPGLRERSFGSFQGRTFQQIETESPEQATVPLGPRMTTPWCPPECPPVGMTETPGSTSRSPSAHPSSPQARTSWSSGWS